MITFVKTTSRLLVKNYFTMKKHADDFPLLLKLLVVDEVQKIIFSLTKIIVCPFVLKV
jgi:hypothetical protein